MPIVQNRVLEALVNKSFAGKLRQLDVVGTYADCA